MYCITKFRKRKCTKRLSKNVCPFLHTNDFVYITNNLYGGWNPREQTFLITSCPAGKKVNKTLNQCELHVYCHPVNMLVWMLPRWSFLHLLFHGWNKIQNESYYLFLTGIILGFFWVLVRIFDKLSRVSILMLRFYVISIHGCSILRPIFSDVSLRLRTLSGTHFQYFH